MQLWNSSIEDENFDSHGHFVLILETISLIVPKMRMLIHIIYGIIAILNFRQCWINVCLNLLEILIIQESVTFYTQFMRRHLILLILLHIFH